MSYGLTLIIQPVIKGKVRSVHKVEFIEKSHTHWMNQLVFIWNPYESIFVC